ncbi:MAG TPA: nitrilase-related carbon-nitrogen hydrolase [Cyclobacteriaceae bacterium]|nr:nitrilase-related carbon-nitrogen hydrolase [Cyclobacteriaceae bacterium]
MKTKFDVRIAGMWLLTTAVFILLSPKWLFAPAGWFAPALLLWFVSSVTFWRGVVLGWLALLVSGLIAGYGVLPFPGIFFVIMVTVISAVKIIPYVISNWLVSKFGVNWLRIFIFPCALVASEYIDSFGGGGTWGSLAYSQFENHHLMQLTSLFGIWSVTFLLGWFASLVNWMVTHRFAWQKIKANVILFSTVILTALLYGGVKTNNYFSQPGELVRISGITANNVELVKAMYEDYFDRKVDIDPDRLSQTSPELHDLQEGFIRFIENPFDKNFNTVHKKINAYQDSLLAIADKEAKAGAKLITFSEGLFLTTKSEENVLIEKGRKVAEQNKVYLALSVASLLPGKIETGSKYMENKIVLLNPEGKTEMTFFKNKPVPVVEGSIPGNGEVPVVKTPFGKVALSICYDADFPRLMRKASIEGADMMILPSGDWREVSPYHGQMAVVRAIENGFSLFRMVSGATSVATDPDGRILGSHDFYSKGERILTVYVPVRRIVTLYSLVGDVLAWISVGVIFLLCLVVLLRKIPMFSDKLSPLKKDYLY